MFIWKTAIDTEVVYKYNYYIRLMDKLAKPAPER